MPLYAQCTVCIVYGVSDWYIKQLCVLRALCAVCASAHHATAVCAVRTTSQHVTAEFAVLTTSQHVTAVCAVCALSQYNCCCVCIVSPWSLLCVFYVLCMLRAAWAMQNHVTAARTASPHYSVVRTLLSGTESAVRYHRTVATPHYCCSPMHDL